RAVAALGSRVVRIGSARATRYALAREVPRAGGHRWPLYRIDPTGRSREVGVLTALQRDWWRLEPTDDCEIPVTNPAADWTSRGLPGSPAAPGPQGFRGRAFGGRFAPPVGAPADANAWRDDDVLAALALYGSDLPGDLVVGETALADALRAQF